MHLIYLYIGDFRCLKNASLNFDLNYKFKVIDHKICLVSELPDKINLSDFFSFNERDDRGCISNINAIIGPNGSGKTTLAFVLQQLAKGMPVPGDCIAIFKNDARDKGGKELYCCASVDKGRKEYELEDRLVSRCEIGPFRMWRTMIYYSPVYSAVHPIIGDQGKVYDVSTTAQIRKMPNVYLQEQGGRRELKASAVYDAIETRSILELLNESKARGLFSVMPVGLRFAPSKYALAVYQQEALSTQVLENDLRVMLDSPEFDEDDIDRAAVFGRVITWAVNTGRSALAFALYAIGVVRTAFNKSENLYNRRFAFYAKELYVFCKTRLMDAQNDSEALLRIDEFLGKEAEKNGNLNDWYRGISIGGLIEGAKTVFNMIGSLPFSSRSDYKMGALYHDFLLTSSGEGLATDKILSLMSSHSKSAMGMDYLEFSLDPPVSSGEAAFLSMFGRILNALRELRCTQESIFPALVFLDEGETTLHPSMQRSLVSNFIRFCEHCTEDMDIQIIFASHSPTLLSDIPKDNVCFLLGNDKESNFQEEDIEKWPNTFGANIFDLYRLAFNQSKGTTGEFATRKIYNALADVASVVKSRVECTCTANTHQSLNSATKEVLSQIGDPVIRKYLDCLKTGGLI